MNFGEMIVIVLNKMVVPEYDHIDRVMFKQFGLVGTKRFYEIIFVIKEGYSDMSVDMKKEISFKAQDLIPMVGLEKHEDYGVFFKINNRKVVSWE